MRKSFFILTLFMIVLLTNCTNQKNNTLESNNKQLQQQVDSLSLILKKQKEVTDRFRMMMDSVVIVAQKNAAEAEFQSIRADKAIQVADRNAAEAQRQGAIFRK